MVTRLYLMSKISVCFRFSKQMKKKMLGKSSRLQVGNVGLTENGDMKWRISRLIRKDLREKTDFGPTCHGAKSMMR